MLGRKNNKRKYREESKIDRRMQYQKHKRREKNRSYKYRDTPIYLDGEENEF